MSRYRWPALSFPQDELGAVVHGPVILARVPGVSAGLRCVFAHPTGLHLPVVVRAGGLPAEAASRAVFGDHRNRGEDRPDPWASLSMTVEVNGRAGVADPGRAENSGGGDSFFSEAAYWIGELPTDGIVRLTVSWAHVGLSAITTTLALGSLVDLADRVISMDPT